MWLQQILLFYSLVLLRTTAELKRKFENLENDNNELKSDMKDLKKDMKAIKAALKYQKVMLEKMSAMLYVPKNNLKIFPLKDLDEVKALDSFLSNFSDDELITYTRSIIGSTPITKCIHLLFTENALVHVNWDGRQKKFPVKSLKFFQQIIFSQSTTAAQRTARRKPAEVITMIAYARSKTKDKNMMASDYSSDFNTTKIADKETNSYSNDGEEHPLLRKQISTQENLTQLSTMDMFKLVYESVNLNNTKMNSIIDSQKELKRRLVDLEEGTTVRRHVVQGQFADIADNLENFLPLKTYEDFVIFEEKLNDKRFYDDTARYMKSLGGDTHHELVRGILDGFMSNCLAVKFNMDGKFLKKKDGHGNDLTPKVPLTSSKFYKCIIKAAKLKNEDMDEKVLRSKTIGPWLSGATLRADRERKKKDRQQHRQHK